MKLIFWIEKNDFSRNLFEKIIKSEGHNFYGISRVEDFAYLIHDLSPDLIVLDSETIRDHLSQFKSEYEKSDELLKKPVFIIGESAQLEFIKTKVLEIPRPVKAFEFGEILKDFFQKKIN